MKGSDEEWGDDGLSALDGPSREDLNRFMERVAIAKDAAGAPGPGRELPEIEVPRRVIAHFNRQSMKGFDDVGYFIYQGVKVFEFGKREEAARRDARTMEQVNHPNSK